MKFLFAIAAIQAIFILNFNICESGSLKFRQNDSLASRESQASHANDSNIIVGDDVLLAHVVKRLNDEHATDAKRFERRSSSSSFVPVNSEASSSNRNFFREMLNRRNDNGNVVEYTANPSYSNYNYRRYGGAMHRYTREVHIKQGSIVGTVRELSAQMRLKNVDQFLGIPYAEAPIDSRRFMPPSTAIPWQGIKYANKLESVCPQVLPDLSDPSGYNKGRYDQIKRLLPFLKSESEDCLYLNLYVPSYDDSSPHRNFPVIVFLHESFEWNSGNPYDGSILASYGQVIVITLNYRLGSLGFMKPGLNDQTVANFGLLDIIAALQWIKENIEAFGGNKNLVTLLGYDHGAILANFLMISPVAKGLFHRTILMSGSALADWALNYNPQKITMQVAKKLNCPIEDAQLGDCLRKKPYREILNVSVTAPEFTTIFGPIVDGLVVPSDPHQVMAHSDTFGKFDLLFGMTEIESYNIFGRDAILEGIEQIDRDHNIQKYLATRFDKRLEIAFLSTLKEYSSSTFLKSKPMSRHDHRDLLLEILSDARVAAPLIQTGSYLSRRNPKCYMYVFSHNAEAGEHATISQSIHGEDLPFVFGAPLGAVGPFQNHYNVEERLLSEAVMRYFTNFAKTGNPTVPWIHHFNNLGAVDWKEYDVDWQEFNEINQNYLLLSTRPVMSHFYRHRYTKFWNEDLIDAMRNANSPNQYGKFYNTAMTPRNLPSEPMSSGQVISMYPIKVEISHPTEDPIREVRYRLQQQSSREFAHNNNHHSTESINYEQMPEEHEIFKSEATTMYLLIFVIVTFVLVNMMGLLVYLYRRNKKIKRKYDNSNIFDAVSDDKRSKFNDTDDSFILDILRKSSNNTYESVKRHSPINGYAINRQTSTSTVDTHTKVSDWISNEISKYSPKQTGLSFVTKKEKISVAIDATPQARSNSILRQEPIEVTKAKSQDYVSCGKIICQEVDMDVSMIDEIPFRGFHNGSIEEQNESETSSCSCSTFSNCEECIQQLYLADAIKMPYHQMRNGQEEVTSFIDAPRDINVTCRDSVEKCPLSPEESLKAIQKMNCPKVLPNYPENMQLNDATKRRSLQVPPQYYQIHDSTGEGCIDSLRPSSSRPEPPPRLSSTLGRNGRTEDRSSCFMTKPLQAQEPPLAMLEREPEATQSNTLIVGPIVPKSEGIYMTMQRRRSLSRQNSISSCQDEKLRLHGDASDIKYADDCDECNEGAAAAVAPKAMEEHLYSEIIKNSRVQTPQDGIYSITANSRNKPFERKSSSNSQESNSSTSSSSESSTGTVRKIN